MRFLATAYCHFYRAVKRVTNYDMPGLGYALRSIRRPFTFNMSGATMRFEPSLAVSYGVLLTGHPSEPETHRFFEAVRATIPTVTVVDVGANIGEMAVPWGMVSPVIAFEPFRECADVIRQGARLSGAKVDVREIALSSVPGLGTMVGENTNGAHLEPGNGPVRISTLDAELEPVSPALLLIDVEGHELEVMKGGKRFIGESRPVIVFEHHSRTRNIFSLNDVATVLPAGYEFYRLRQDGKLDRKWHRNLFNVVAWPVELPVTAFLRGQ